MIFSIVTTIFLVFIGLLQIFEKRLIKNRFFKKFYLQTYYDLIEIYIFSDLSIDKAGCSNVVIETEKVDANSKYQYKFPFKLCLPNHSLLKREIEKLTIKFKSLKKISVTIYEEGGENLGDSITLDGDSLKKGCQGKYSLLILSRQMGLEIDIYIETTFYKKSGKSPGLIESKTIINGIKADSFKTRV
jgi:hypothetical protein